MTDDHLLSTGIVTDAGGAVQTRHDYLPFGEEIASSHGGRSGIAGYSAGPVSAIRLKFTGKERDSESGLDWFGSRYRNVNPTGRNDARGDFFVRANVGHVVNAVNQKGTIRYLDDQTGKAFKWSNGYEDIRFLRTF